MSKIGGTPGPITVLPTISPEAQQEVQQKPSTVVQHEAAVDSFGITGNDDQDLASLQGLLEVDFGAHAELPADATPEQIQGSTLRNAFAEASAEERAAIGTAFDATYGALVNNPMSSPYYMTGPRPAETADAFAARQHQAGVAAAAAQPPRAQDADGNYTESLEDYTARREQAYNDAANNLQPYPAETQADFEARVAAERTAAAGAIGQLLDSPNYSRAGNQVGVWGEQAGITFDDNEVVAATLTFGVENAELELQEFAMKYAATLQGKKDIREDIADLRATINDWPEGQETVTFRTTEIVDGEIVHSDVALTKEQAEVKLEELQMRLDTTSEMGQMQQLQLQDMQQKLQQAYQVLSNILKMLHDTAKSIIQNVRA